MTPSGWPLCAPQSLCISYVSNRDVTPDLRTFTADVSLLQNKIECEPYNLNKHFVPLLQIDNRFINVGTCNYILAHSSLFVSYKS